MVLTASFVISPAIGFFATVARSVLTANLTPASRRQDHTTSPSASKTPSSEAPPASIASNPASVTIAIRPSSGVDGRGYKVICDFGKPEYFFGRDWTRQISLIRLRKLDSTRKATEARSLESPARPGPLQSAAKQKPSCVLPIHSARRRPEANHLIGRVGKPSRR